MSSALLIESFSERLKLQKQFIELKELFSPLLQQFPVYLVGGSVRDALLKNPVGLDLDCVVEKEGGAKAFAFALKAKYPKIFTDPHSLGREYPIWQLVFNEERGLFPKGTRLEIADSQAEMFPDPATRERVTQFGNLDVDALRRDFSVNALYWDFKNQTLRDPSGFGMQDLDKKILRSPQQSQKTKNFSDDPLRIVRLFRFVCQLGFSVDSETFEAALSVSSRLSILSAERIRDELLKVLKTGRAFEFFEKIKDTGLLEKLFPEFLLMVGCEQDPRFHSEGDVWTHTLLVMKNAEPTEIQQLTALLHDIGKPQSKTQDGNRIRFLGHEKISVQLGERFLKRFRFSADLAEKVLKLVSLHLRGSDVERWSTSKPARKLLRELGDLKEEFLKFVEADSRSSVRPDGSVELKHVQALRDLFLQVESLGPVSKKYPMTGDELMRVLNIQPGPQIKQIQEFLREAEDGFVAEKGMMPSSNQLKIWAQEALTQVLKKDI